MTVLIFHFNRKQHTGCGATKQLLGKKTIMAKQFNNGDIVYAGYPTTHVYDFKRNSSNKLVFTKVKELLWGDWISVRPYDYRTSNNADIRKASEQAFVDNKIAEIDGTMIQVRVRGRSGYMHLHDVEENRLLEVVFVDVGQGDGALMVTPDDKKYVIDAGDRDNMYRYLRWRFAGFSKTHTDFDGLIITHPDRDHYNGFNQLIEDPEVEAENIWHNGLMEQFEVGANGQQASRPKSTLGQTKIENGRRYITELIEDDSQLGDFLSNQDRWIKRSTGRAKMFPDLLNDAFTAKTGSRRRFKNIAMLSTKHGEMHNGKAYLPHYGPNNAKNCVIEIVGPVVENDTQGGKRLRVFNKKPKEKEKSLDKGKTKNGHSILLQVKYKNVKLFLGGDLNSSAEMFLLDQASNLDVYSEIKNNPQAVVDSVGDTFRCDVAKACHHGSADFTNSYLQAVNAVATVISSGDNEKHAHPRSDTLGAIGNFGRGQRSLIFSTELARSTKEFTDMEETPWGQAMLLKLAAEKESDQVKKMELLAEAQKLFEIQKTVNVTVYGAINLRTDGEKVVLSYMIESPSETNKWDVYTLEPDENGVLKYRKADSDSEASKRRLKLFNAGSQ
jgi:beta-lactamase superfamily II metal-dependent hydrolase